MIKTLNLVNKEKSDINYEIITFSDSQELMTIPNSEQLYKATEVRIVSRFSWNDLQRIILAKKCLDNTSSDPVSLMVPYFLGARSDRKFNADSVNYLKDIICPLINSLEFKYVISYDPHSYSLECCLDRFHSATNSELLDFAFLDINKLLMLVTPKEGASKKINALFKNFRAASFVDEIIECSKDRNPHTGAILGIKIPKDNFQGRDLVIIDDICDAGRTFIELAKVLKTRNVGKMYLIVTHGIFSKGLVELENYFERIYCTNSVSDITYHKVKQLNVF